MRELECIEDEKRARSLLHPLRRQIIQLAGQPASATELAARLGMPRQRINYHVRQLAGSALLRRAGRRRRGNLLEQRYVATARAYVLSPAVLGPLGADWRTVEDAASASYLLALSEQVRRDLARVWTAAQIGDRRASTLSIKAQFRFESAAQRASFARSLRAAIVGVIARETSPDLSEDGRPGTGRPYRLVVGCYPYAGEKR
jgi:DNA-binding transcriptional ArsR family regulator